MATVITMKRLSINPILLLVTTIAIISYHGHLVDGTGYSGDQSSKGIDNSDKSGSANYRFEYGVDDGGAGQQFGHEEERNGHLTRGRYSVLLPDGRLQVTTYRADENGYKADVTYENGPSGANSGGGYSSNGAEKNTGGYSYESVQTAATSYVVPVPPTQRNSVANGAYQGSKSSGISRSFVKLRRTIDGKMFNYSY